jgi:hypothetical protein
MRHFPALVMIVVTSTSGCAPAPAPSKFDNALAAMQKAEKFELLSLAGKDSHWPGSEVFHDCKVIGSTSVEDNDTRKRLVSALKKGFAERSKTELSCFMPRHGIRINYQGKTIDFAICFTCCKIQQYSGDVHEATFLTTASPEDTFDDILKSANVPIGK